MKRSMGTLLLSIWLIVQGLTSLASFNFPYLGVIMALLALIAGILLLVGR
jgi:hypothetical protein